MFIKEAYEKINGIVVEKKDSKVIQAGIFNRKGTYLNCLDNIQNVGGKQYVKIPLTLLEIDEDYQRIKLINRDKIYDLINNWNANLFEAILVSPHPETNSFAVINGSHRCLAWLGKHKERELENISILACVAQNLSSDPGERKIEEAKIFCGQGVQDDRLIACHKHMAYVCQGIKKYTVLQKCIQNRKLLLNIHELKNMDIDTQNARRAEGWKVLSGYGAAVMVAGHNDGEKMLNTVFDIIEKSGWRDATNGYSAFVIKAINSVLNLHNVESDVVNAIINIFTEIDPNTFSAKAHALLPERREAERNVIWLEKEVANYLGIEPLYTGGDLRKITVKMNKQRYLASQSTPLPTTGTEN